MNKKGMTTGVWTVLIMIVLVVVVIVVGILMLSGSFGRFEETEKRIASQYKDYDDKCLRATSYQKVFEEIPSLYGEESTKIVDKDLDDRDDKICDWCVCGFGEGCHNDKKEDDNDGDKLPKACDADDNDKQNINFKSECGKLTNTDFGPKTQCWYPK